MVLPSRATIPDGWSARQRRRFRQTAPMPHGGRKRQPKSEIVVVSALKDWSCAECSGGGSLLTMGDKGPLCLGCADLAHLVFLPAGDAARPDGRGRRAASRPWSFASAGRGSTTSVRASWSRRKLSSGRRPSASPTPRLARGAASGSALVVPGTTSPFKLRWRRRSFGSFRAVPATGPRRSLVTRARAAAVEWAAAPPAEPSILERSSLPWPRRFATATRAMTSCSCQASRGPRPGIWFGATSGGCWTSGVLPDDASFGQVR